MSSYTNIGTDEEGRRIGNCVECGHNGVSVDEHECASEAPIIKFQTADINLEKEYAEARKMMGLKSTDLNKLYQTVAHIYICIPEEHQKWVDAYLNLMTEIEMRQTMLFNMKLEAIS